MTTPLAIRIVFWTWLIAAVAAGRQGWLQAMPASAVPALVLGLTALLALAYRRLGAFSAWVDALDTGHPPSPPTDPGVRPRGVLATAPVHALRPTRPARAASAP